MVISNRLVGGAILALVLLSMSGSTNAAEPELRLLALDLVNADRNAQGLTVLEGDAALCRAAQDHAEDMLARNYFDHFSPEGEDVMDRYAAAGGNRWLGVAENIFKCVACREPLSRSMVREMHRQWMQSKDHREAILSPNYSRFCFGLAADPEKGYAATQTFAGAGGSRHDGPGREPRAMSLAELRGFALALINDERRGQDLSVLRASNALSSDAEAFLQAELMRDPKGHDLLSTERVREYLSGHDKGAWFKVGVLLEACGGCGVELTDADVAYFAESWSRHAEFRATLLGPEFDSFGLAMVADGNGRKIVLGLFGDRGD